MVDGAGARGRDPSTKSSKLRLHTQRGGHGKEVHFRLFGGILQATISPSSESHRIRVNRSIFRSLLVSFFSLTLFCALEHPSLADWNLTDSEKRVSANGASFSVANGMLHVETEHVDPWPGIKVTAPGGHWDLTPYAAIELQVKNLDSEPFQLLCRVDNPGADGILRCTNGSVRIEPGKSGRLRVTLKRTTDDNLGGWLFGMRGYPAGPGGPSSVNPAFVNQILVFFSKPATNHVFEIESIRAVDTYVPPTASSHDADPYFPFIDSFGQYRHKDWPGKIHSDAELVAQRDSETGDLEKHPGPANWDRFGGWKDGPQIEATGYFRVQKHEGKWWLVDPDGRLFFSAGIDTIGAPDATPIEERENWFADFSGANAEFAPFYKQDAFALLGHYGGRKVHAFSFGLANLRRKYGVEWPSLSHEIIHRRLRSWGINTIGLWSDENLRLQQKTPYVDGISSGEARSIAASGGHWGKFPDPFDPTFREALSRSVAEKRNKSAGDPWCIGYFSDNEMSWGDDTSLALAALQSPPDQPAKKALIATLQNKYQDIAKLNDAWNDSYRSWDDLLSQTRTPNYAKARPDLVELYTQIAEEYFRVVRDILKSTAPKQLYLGCRFAWGNDRAQAVAAKYCDVVSFNLYYRDLKDFVFEGNADVPLIVGEFHFGALDRGMFHPGLVAVEDQQARAQAYRHYVTGAIRDPRFVGCHWFEYQDEPNTGRTWDEENFQIGFVDVADTPYTETIKASRAVGSAMYETRASKPD